MNSNPVNRVRSLVGGEAHILLGDLLKAGDAPRLESARLSAEGWTVEVRAFPSSPGEGLEGLSRCEQGCLDLLQQHRAPLPAKLIRKELETRKLGRYSIATVKRALGRLRKLKVISNTRKAPRGYYLVASLPLVRLASGT
jgi:hypothetical protein